MASTAAEGVDSWVAHVPPSSLAEILASTRILQRDQIRGLAQLALVQRARPTSAGACAGSRSGGARSRPSGSAPPAKVAS